MLYRENRFITDLLILCDDVISYTVRVIDLKMQQITQFIKKLQNLFKIAQFKKKEQNLSYVKFSDNLNVMS